MIDKDTTIGLWYDYSDSRLITIFELAEEKKADKKLYPISQYCDFRYATNLRRFNFDPFTGKKIDWKEVKKLLTELVER